MNGSPLVTDVTFGSMRTRTAAAPAPEYWSGTATAGAAADDEAAGTAMTAIGPPLNTVSPCALMQYRNAASGSPDDGASEASGIANLSESESASGGNATSVSSAATPEARVKTTRTRVNGATANAPAVCSKAGGNAGLSDRARAKRTESPMGAIGSRPQLSNRAP